MQQHSASSEHPNKQAPLVEGQTVVYFFTKKVIANRATEGKLNGTACDPKKFFWQNKIWGS